MAATTTIEWTDRTWNPIVGCSVTSPGCTNCYAMKQAARIEAMFHGKTHYAGTTRKTKAGPVFNGKVVLAPPHILTEPLRWKKPQKIFVNSMGDLFHENVPDAWIDQVFGVMGACDDQNLGHEFQILTKRSRRQRDYMRKRAHKAWNARRLATEAFPPRNIWLGVSVEDQARADERIPDLLDTPAKIRFISAEPLLGPVELSPKDRYSAGIAPGNYRVDVYNPLTGYWECDNDDTGSSTSTGFGPKLDWVICGGESGRNARPMHPDWVRSLRDQCAAAGVPFLLKQWGEYRPTGFWPEPVMFGIFPNGEFHRAGELMCGQAKVSKAAQEMAWARISKVGKKAAGNMLDGRQHLDSPHPEPVEGAGEVQAEKP